MVSDGTVEVLEGLDGGSNRKEAEAIEVDDVEELGFDWDERTKIRGLG